jgi:hypothetical protein
MVSRRTFLVTGTLGAAALAAAGGIALLRRGRTPAPTAFDAEQRDIVAAIVPALLGSALPAEPAQRVLAIDETVAGVARAYAGLPPAARTELGQLFSLLAFAPARRGLAGVAAPWSTATSEEVGTFLAAWRDSGWALKRSAYDAFHQLIYAAWYGNPRSWPAIGYPGPPALAT